MYDTCLKLKVLGLPQSHKTGSRYQVTPELVLNAEELGELKTITGDDADWTPFVYIPTIEDLISFLGKDFGEVRRMVNQTDPTQLICAYSFEPQEDGGNLRAFGSNVWEALANLSIAVKSYVPEKASTVQSE